MPKFHYAKCVPSISYAFNVFNDDDEWCGVICYGVGACPQIAKAFGLYQGEVLELVRVALNGKQEITSKAVALSLKLLHKIAPQIKIIVSYADKDQSHIGIIYQATNWIYLGETTANKKAQSYIINGKKYHNKTIHDKKWTLEYIKNNIDKNAVEVSTKGKHKYIYYYDKKLLKEWKKKAKTYPK